MRRMTRTLTPVVAGVVVAALGLVMGPAPFGGTATLTSPPTVSASQWTNAHAPSASGSNLLNDVSCTTASFCVAVGQQNSGAGGGTLVEQWNGSSWVVVPSVNVPATSGDNLVSVSCVGPSFCMAVGSSGLGAVAETWNGTAWTLATPVIPSNVTGGAALWSVSCVSTTVCETLGTGFNVSTPEVFGNQWNGTAWSLVSAATPSASGGPPLIEATGMDCVSDDFVHRRRDHQCRQRDGDAIQRAVERIVVVPGHGRHADRRCGDRQLPGLRLVCRCLVL